MSPVRPDLKVVGRRDEPGDHALRDFLTRAAQPFEWFEAGSEAAAELLRSNGAVDAELPAVFDDGRVLAPATVASVAASWGEGAPPSQSTYDIAIVGAGPAGLAAAVYAASDGLSTVVLEREIPGGQASHTSMIENFFGFPDGIGGAELARLAGRQAERFGAELVLMRGLSGSRHDDGCFKLEVGDGHWIEAPLMIVAPGMEWRRLDAEGAHDLLGRGVYYGAGRSEAAQCGGDEVIVIGAGNSAGQGAMYLADSGARVTIVVRGDSLAKSMSAYLIERIEAHPQIEVLLRSEVDAVEEEDGLLAAALIRDRDGGVERRPARALFICIGGQPCTSWAEETGVRVGPAGFILTGPDLIHEGERPAEWPLERDPLALETSIPGLFAAGDVRHGSPRRVGGAVGDGAMAVSLAHRVRDKLPHPGNAVSRL